MGDDRADREALWLGALDDEARAPAQADAGTPKPGGPPPLTPFGLVLHHDASWRHEGQPIRNRKLREHFDRSVVYLPDEQKYVVRLGHFRGEIEVEEAAFFVRDVDTETGRLHLSDESTEDLVVADLHPSPLDGALLCRVKRDLRTGGLLARFGHAAQAELLGAVTLEAGVAGLRIGGAWQPLPALD